MRGPWTRTSLAIALPGALVACGINPAFTQTSDTTDAATDPTTGPPDPLTSSTASASLPDPTTSAGTSGGLDATGPDDTTSTSSTSTSSTSTASTTTSSTSDTGDTGTTGAPTDDCPDDDALVACYPFPAREYAVLVDGSGNGHDGTLANVNLPDNPLGYGQAVEFYSDGSRATVAYDEAFTVEELTIAAFVFVKSKHKAIVDKHGQYAMFVDDGQASCILRGAGVLTTIQTSIPNDEQWLHLACTYDGDFLTIHVAYKGSRSSQSVSHEPGIDQDPESDLAIGRDAPEDQAHFIGLIDQVLVYDRALGADEICGLADPLCP